MNISIDTENKVRQLLQQNRKLDAVKLVYETAHCGLKEAKDYVDQLQSPGKPGPPASGNNMDDILLSLLAANKKLHAVKYYKDQTGAGLKESAEYVEKLDRNKKRGQQSSTMNTEIDKIVQQQQTSQPRQGSLLLKVCIFLIITALCVYLLFLR